ncbi:MAG: hypothetical protein PHW76_08255 [Alphaproteobacteria bacterium]|nr:hypothetical protein [Alphaproteobacteria bacterium]
MTDTSKCSFDQMKDKIKETWDRLSDDDIALYNGNEEQFFGKVQEVYGISKEDAESRIKEIQESCPPQEA